MNVLIKDIFLKLQIMIVFFVGIWKSAKALALQRASMISPLNKVVDLLRELSPKLGVTDPFSGNIVSL